MSRTRCSCGECMCHFMGLVILVISCALMVTGLVLVSLFQYPAVAFLLGLGFFGLGGLLSILFLVYMCIAFKLGWRLFGCFGKWGPGNKDGKPLVLDQGDNDISRRLTGSPSTPGTLSSIEEGSSNPTDW